MQSRIKEIDKLQPMELKKSNIQRPYVRFATPEKPSGQLVFKLHQVSKGYPHQPVLKNLSFEIHKGDKIAVIGNNGQGKSTLLKLLASISPPDQGTLQIGHQVEVGYFPQNHEEIVDKHAKLTSFDWLKARRASLFDQDVRGVLGKMLFSGDDAFKEVRTLSGGETARLILGGLMLTAPNVLLLDEPNNHLDLEAVSALAWGLEEFKGTVIVASHDRDLIAGFATKILAFEEGRVTLFQGPLEEYLAARTQKSASAKKS